MRARAYANEQGEPDQSLAAPRSSTKDEPAEAVAPDKQAGGIQSVARAFSILEEVAKYRDGIALGDISKAVGLHYSTAFHLVKTLVSLGYVRQMADNRRYVVGGSLFALASGALNEIEMANLATPILEELSAETGETCHFAVRMGDSVVAIAKTSGFGAFQFAERVGVVKPAHSTALGKIMLSALNDEQLERYLSRAVLKSFTARSITDKQHLRRHVEEARRVGVAFDDGEFDAEVRCVAVPVRDFTGRILGAIGISGPVWRLSLQILNERVEMVKAAAERLSAQFGALSNN